MENQPVIVEMTENARYPLFWAGVSVNEELIVHLDALPEMKGVVPGKKTDVWSLEWEYPRPGSARGGIARVVLMDGTCWEIPCPEHPRRELGGSSANAAISIRRLWGEESVVVSGLVSKDSAGEELVASLKAAGLGVFFVVSEPFTPRTFSLLDSSGRATLLCMKRKNEVSPAVVQEFAKIQPQVALFTSIRKFDLPVAEVILRSSTARLKFLTPNASLFGDWETQERFRALLQYLDILQVNEDECTALLGRPFNRDDGAQIQELSRIGPSLIVVTLGKKGVALVERGKTEAHFQPAYQVEKPVGDSGAGDVFAGTFVLSLFKGYSPLVCLRAAAWVAAKTVATSGPSEGLPTADEFHSFLRSST